MIGPTIDSLMVADYAEVVNGKLYVMGGGFSAVQMVDFDQPYRCAVAAALRVPWDHTNQLVDFTGHLETLDAEPLDCWSLQGQFEAGRAPGQRGEDTITMFAAPVEVRVPAPMDIVLRFTFGTDERTVRFKIVAAA